MHVTAAWLVLLSLSLAGYVPPQQDSVVQAARPLDGNPPPAYPTVARGTMVVGDVIFRALVTEKGRVAEVSILKVPEEDRGFEDAVREAVSDWRFEPARNGNDPIVTAYVGKVSFSLRPKEEEALRNIVERWTEAWNRADAKAMASLFDPEGLIDLEDDLAKGHNQIERWFAGRLAGKYKGTRLRVDLEKIRFLSKDFAAMEQRLEIAHTSNKATGTVKDKHSLLIRQDEAGRWSILIAVPADWIEVWHEGERYRSPKLVKRVTPTYPDAASGNGIEGSVEFDVVIGLEGKPTSITVLRSVPALEQAAIEAVVQWRFDPGTIHGIPVPTPGHITVDFFLDSRP